MNEVLQQYIYDKEKERRAEYDKKKTAFLISEGLCYKEYSPDGSDHSGLYPEYEYRNDTNTGYYYRWVAMDVTDEEYERILSLNNVDNVENNKIANILTVIAVIIFVLGFILGIVFASDSGEYNHYYSGYSPDFSFATAIAYWAISFISGMMMLGFAEIIKLLHKLTVKK